jgi:RNA polymerase sigma-70 factor (ECF subfamily)
MVTKSQEARFFAEVEAHKRILSKVGRTYCREPADREDLVQEIVVQLWQSFPRFDGRSKFSTWMYKVALNVAISYQRREIVRNRHVISDEAHLLNVPDGQEDEPHEVRLLYELIDGMNPLDRALILLYLDGYSQQEIAQVLGITATNVGTKIGRLKQSMQDQVASTREPSNLRSES